MMEKNANDRHDIAIIGMAALLPEAQDYEQFWQNLAAGRESVRELPESRKKLAPFYDPRKEYARFGYIEGIDLFDPLYFKTLPATARSIDPAQRLLLEMVNNAIEDAGYCRDELHDQHIGTFLGDYAPEYYQYLADEEFDILTGNLPANLAGRVAYLYGFNGPAMTIDTACSSALMALHTACRSLRNGECKLAVVGGASIKIDLQEKSESNLGIMSPTEVCRTFSADADGVTGGEGVIALLLKPLKEALAAGDNIHAVIKGSAANQDGARSNGLTAPSPFAQKEVIQMAWQDAEIDPLTVTFIETHGTATKLGDPIEITGLTDAFREMTGEKRFCPIGAVKTNIGHLGNIAGLAGLLKVVLALKAGEIPPTINFTRPNPFIDFENAPVYVATEKLVWLREKGPRRAGVSSFGLSGTNCHVILEESPVPESFLTNERAHVFAISGPTAGVLEAKVRDLYTYLENQPELNPADLSFTLNCGRQHYGQYRMALMAKSVPELLRELGEFVRGENIFPTALKAGTVDFSSQDVSGEMHGLSGDEEQVNFAPVYLLPDYDDKFAKYCEDYVQAGLPNRHLIEECQQVMDLSEEPKAAFFAFQYALAHLWMELGVKPLTVIGIGVGEAVSAALAKRMTLAEAMQKAVFGTPAPFNAEKLRQFIGQQIKKGRNLFIHFGESSRLADEVAAEIGSNLQVKLLHCYGEMQGTSLAQSLAWLYAQGMDLHWQAFGQGRRLPLPGYPYEKKSYWFDVEAANVAENVTAEPETAEAWTGAQELALTVDLATIQGQADIARVLGSIWRERLGLEQVELDADFIDLGGDSVRGMLLMRDIQKYFGVTLDIAYLLQYGTIRALAEKIWSELMANGTTQLLGVNETGIRGAMLPGSAPTNEMQRATGEAAVVADQIPGGKALLRETNLELVNHIPRTSPKTRQGNIAYYNMSPSQKNLWLVHQLTPDEVAYNEPLPIVLKGPLNREALHRALQRMIERHASMRTFFTTLDDEPVQGVYDNLQLEITYEDATHINIRRDSEGGSGFASESVTSDEGTLASDIYDIALLEQYIHAEAARPFDMSEAPLFRAKLVKFSEDEHLFVMIVHHIIFDGWSILIFRREVCQLYEAFANGQPDPLPEPDIQYYDFADWQSRLFQEGRMAEAERYWLYKLSGDLPVLDMPTDYPRPAEKSYEGSSIYFTLPEELSVRVKEFARRSGTTLFATMLAFFEVILHKYSGQFEFVIGTPSANRPGEQLWNQIGFFVNTFAVRQQVLPEESFTAFLQRVKQNLLESYHHRDYPFTELVSKLNLKRDPGRSALFDVMYVYHNVGSIEMKKDQSRAEVWGGVEFIAFNKREIVSDYDFKLEFEEAVGYFNGKIEYSTRLFTQETIERFGAHLVHLIADVLENPTKRVADICILPEAEQEVLLEWFNATEAEFSADMTLTALLEAQVLRTPDATAALFGEDSLTYRELDERASKLARVLQARGVGRDKIVGVLMDRSLEMLVALYGIGKAGGAYLPIDPAYPAERIQYMLQDSEVQILLIHTATARKIVSSEALGGGTQLVAQSSESQYSETLPGGILPGDASGIEILRVDDPALYTGVSSERLESSTGPDDLLYVIYTSGSTGKPKGVMLEHRAVVNRLQWMQKEYPLSADDTILQKTPFTFDVSVWELFWWGLYGAKVCMLEPGGEKEPESIVEAVQRNRVTTMHFVPSMLNAFLQYLAVNPDEVQRLCSLKQVFSSGEALKKQTIERFKEMLTLENQTSLHNLYGPTEAAVDVSYFDCAGDILGETVPIGRPIDNIQLYILDPETLALKPLGLPGEICIAGVGLARGYQNRPELTAEKFIANPFTTGARMYRTGDLGRYQADGNIEYLGRIDHQVKIRGYRIELGEIEAALLKRPEVQDAVVIALEDESGAKDLVAFICLRAEVKAQELRETLLTQLPTYMVPKSFTFLQQMPLLPNGKVDRKALAKMYKPEPVVVSAGDSRTGGDPRNELEAKMVQVWAKILRVPAVGIYDNFFELGGDSIKAIQVAAELGKLGLKVQMNEIILHQSIDQLLLHLMTEGKLSIGEAKKDDRPVEGQLPLTPIQHWFFASGHARPEHWDLSVFLELRPDLALDLLEEALAKVFEHHDALRLIYHAATETMVYHNLLLRRGLSVLRYDLSQLSEREQDERIRALGVELKAGFNLEKGPLFAAATFDLGLRGLRLLLVAHHLIMDGVSWRIVLEDLITAYEQISYGNPIQLTPRTSAYKEWAEHLLDYSSSEELTSEIPYWGTIWQARVESQFTLNGARVSNDRDDRDETVQFPKIADVLGELNAKETDTLLTGAHVAYNTNINDLLLTALALSFTETTGEDCLVCDVEGHGREEIFPDLNVTRTVGWFTSIYPVKLEPGKESNLGEQIKAIKEQLHAIPHGGIGYGILRYLTLAWGEPDIKEESEMLFNYLGELDQSEVSDYFNIALEDAGLDQAPENRRGQLFEVVTYTQNGKLQVKFTYARDKFNPAVVEEMHAAYLRHLRAIIIHCTGGNAGYTPSDFELADLKQEELDLLSADLESLFGDLE